MSIKKDVYVKCDNPNCGETAFPSHTAEQARYESQTIGEWIYYDGKDYCPKCKGQFVPEKKLRRKRKS